MNKLFSLLQIKKYKATLLSQSAHSTLSSRLKLFKPDASFNRLSYTHHYDIANYSFVIEQMGRIGWIADEIDHHP